MDTSRVKPTRRSIVPGIHHAFRNQAGPLPFLSLYPAVSLRHCVTLTDSMPQNRRQGWGDLKRDLRRSLRPNHSLWEVIRPCQPWDGEFSVSSKNSVPSSIPCTAESEAFCLAAMNVTARSTSSADGRRGCDHRGQTGTTSAVRSPETSCLPTSGTNRGGGSGSRSISLRGKDQWTFRIGW